MTMQTSDWLLAWRPMLGFSDGASPWLIGVASLLILFLLVVVPSLAILSQVERKFSAAIQSRIGPSRAGPRGLFQGVADFLKLLQKGDLGRATRAEDFWLGALTYALFMTLAFLPLGSLWLITDTEMSALLPLWVALVVALATLMLGISRGTVPGVLGGLRQVSQTVACSLPALVAVLSVGLRSGGFRWKLVAEGQGALPLAWNLFADPFQWINFLVFLCCGPLIMGFRPMDSATSSVDLGGGVGAHLFGVRFWLFRVREFYGLFLWAVLAVVLFCGAWNLPEGLRESMVSHQEHALLLFSETSVLLLKAFFVVLAYYWVSAASPRARADQLSDFGWKVLGPLSLASLTGSILWLAWKGAP